MRIVAGRYKGRRFPAKLPQGVRPTADAVRESIFNTLYNLLSFENIAVLDLFAGSGALGIEALSRGAASCTWVEKSRKTSIYIQNILKSFDIDNRNNRVVTKPALKYLQSIDNEPDAAFGLIFADPPYALKTCNAVLNLIIEKKLLAIGGVIVLEHSVTEHIVIGEGLKLLSDKKYGDTKVEIVGGGV